MKRLLIICLAAAVILYLVPLISLFIFQRSFMYFPPARYLTPEAVGLSDVQEIKIESRAGDTLTGWWMPPEDDDKPVILFFHGNGSAIYSNYDIYADLMAQGYGVMGASYPGYPGNSGKPTQKAIQSGALAHYAWLAAQGIAPERIIYFGTSLGTGAATQLAAVHEPAMLVLEAPFSAAVDLGGQSMPIYPVRLLMRDQFRSHEALEKVNAPMLWVHGTKDNVIPLADGQRLFDSYEGPKQNLVIEGGQHTNLWKLGGREFILSEIAARLPYQ